MSQNNCFDFAYVKQKVFDKKCDFEYNVYKIWTLCPRGDSVPDSNTKFTKTIISAAVKLFKEKGYENVSVNDICKEAGIARSTFYLTFAGKKEIIDKIISDVRLDREDFFGDFIIAENDFERMWILCNRYLTIAISFGPKLLGSLLRLELLGELDIMGMVHQVDEWMIKLLGNSQKTGVILNSEPAERLAPLGVDLAYYSTYEWCKKMGDFNLRQVVRRRAEEIYNVAPEWRMSEENLKML